jgi:hypothetical protein
VNVGHQLQRGLALDAARRLAGRLLDRGEALAGQHVAVADDLVDDVRLGRVERRGRVTDVLGRVEDPVGEGAVELAQRDEPGSRAVLEARQRAQEVGHLVELRDAVARQPQPLDRLAVLAARVALVLDRELAADDAPDLVLLVGVFDVRDRQARRPRQGTRGDLVAPRAVAGVADTRVLLAEVDGDSPILGGRHGRVQLRLLEHPTLLACGLPQGCPPGRRFATSSGTTGRNGQWRTPERGTCCAG